jgi:hypothetical protein
LESIENGHDEVYDENIGMKGLHGIDCLLSSIGSTNVEPRLSQKHCQAVGSISIVVNDKQAKRHRRSLDGRLETKGRAPRLASIENGRST